MSWIERSKLRGRIGAKEEKIASQRAAEEKAMFESEPVSLELLQEYLEPFLIPVINVIQELQMNGFTIQAEDLDYLYLSELKHQEDAKLRRKYSMSKILSVTEGYREDQFNSVVGMSWTIKHKLYPHEVCSILVAPRANARTHFAGVEYKVKDASHMIETPLAHVILEFLEFEVGDWIEEMEKLRTLRSK